MNRYAILTAMVAGAVYAQAQAQTSYPPNITTPDVNAIVSSQVQSATATTDAGGNWTAAWSFTGTPTSVVATIKNSAGNVYECPTTAISATSVSGRCYQIVSNTLPTAAPALLGLVVSPFANPGAGLPVTIIGKM